MSIKVTPDLRLKKPTPVILKGKQASVFHHEKGSTYCVVLNEKGEPVTAALCDLDYVKQPGKGLSKKPKELTEKQINDKKDMNAFFDSLSAKIPFNCQSCRKALYAFNKAAKRSVCAHCLPKSLFPSIAKNPDNIVFLGCDVFGSSCFCHSQYDSSVDRRKKMPIYETVLKRFDILKPYLSKKEIIQAEEYLGLREKSLNLAKDISNNITV